jgi:ribosomal protein S11
MAKKEDSEEPTEKKSEKKQKTEDQEKVVEEPKKVKPKKDKEDISGIAYIYSSSNNTLVHITDLSGNTISRSSGGMVTKHSRLKSNPTIAMFAAKRVAGRAKDAGITSLYVRMRGKTRSSGIGPGAHAALKSLDKEGFRILSIIDTTKHPRGGPKAKGGKRGRRV